MLKRRIIDDSAKELQLLWMLMKLKNVCDSLKDKNLYEALKNIRIELTAEGNSMY